MTACIVPLLVGVYCIHKTHSISLSYCTHQLYLLQQASLIFFLFVTVGCRQHTGQRGRWTSAVTLQTHHERRQMGMTAGILSSTLLHTALSGVVGRQTVLTLSKNTVKGTLHPLILRNFDHKKGRNACKHIKIIILVQLNQGHLVNNWLLRTKQ